MKITLASYHTVNVKHGGPRTQILQTKQHLEDLGHHVKLHETWDGKPDLKSSDLFHLFASNFAVYDLARFLHIEGMPFVTSPIFFTRRSPRVIRWVLRVDTLVRKLAPGIWSDYGFTRDICHWSSAVLPNTESEQSLIIDGLGIPAEKTEVIPNGVEERFLHGDPEPFLEKYEVQDFILNVGHIGVERKNTLSLIRALETIDHPAVIIGKVTDTEEGQACLAETKKNRNLTIIKGLDHDSDLLASAYAAAKVFALPARYETPGIAALEAALAGANIVITPHGGTQDYFRKMAIYVDPYSVNDIRSGLERALNAPPDDKLKKHVQSNFLWQRVTEMTANVYQSVLNQ